MRATTFSLLAGLIARVRINDVDRAVYCKRIYYRKSRYWYSPFIVWGANLVLWVLRIRARFLPLNRWTHRERDVYRYLYNEDVFIGADDRVYVPVRTGICLADYLQDANYSAQEKSAAVAAAAAALQRFHMNVLPHIGRTDVLSHGDATTLNVIYDPALHSAYWIDFETAHADSVSLTERHADDLQTFILSVLANLPDDEFAGRLRQLFAHYTEPEIWFTVQATLERENWDVIFHMARARVGWSAYRAVREKLLVEIPQLMEKEKGAVPKWGLSPSRQENENERKRV